MPEITPTLHRGSHDSPEQGMCFNEAAAWLAGERHSDYPDCVSPVVRRYTMRLNDRLDDEQRQRLRPYVLRALGTAGDGRDEERIEMCREFVLRDALPFYLEKAGMTEEAERVRAMTTWDRTALREIRTAAWKVRDVAWEGRRERIRALVLEKLAEQQKPVAAADAVAVAAADAVAVAVAAADAVAVAAADAVAVAAADAVAASAAAPVAASAAAADADAAAAADADAVAAAVADAAADAAADAVADGGDPWHLAYNAAYKAAKASYQKVYEDAFPGRTNKAFELLDRMLPAEPLKAPVPERAALVAGWFGS